MQLFEVILCNILFSNYILLIYHVLFYKKTLVSIILKTFVPLY
jgi:hypothetical protein